MKIRFIIVPSGELHEVKGIVNNTSLSEGFFKTIKVAEAYREWLHTNSPYT